MSLVSSRRLGYQILTFCSLSVAADNPIDTTPHTFSMTQLSGDPKLIILTATTSSFRKIKLFQLYPGTKYVKILLCAVYTDCLVTLYCGS